MIGGEGGRVGAKVGVGMKSRGKRKEVVGG